MLDLLAGHFSKQLTIVSDEHLAEKKISEFQQVIYLGEIKRTLPKQTVRMMNEAQKVIAIGYNAEQLRPFSNLTFHKQDHTSQIKYTDDQSYRQLEKSISALTVQGADLQSEFLLKKHEADLPFVIQTKEGADYIGILNVVQQNELLAEVLEKRLSSSHQLTTKYLRFGNISPVSDEKKLLELGQYVSTRHIPFLIAVTPVWVDRTTGDEVTLSDRPQLVKVLKQLQSNGASIILHGFSRTYRTEDSGQDFEFWDAKNDQSITSNDPKKPRRSKVKAIFRMKKTSMLIRDRISSKKSSIQKKKSQRALTFLRSKVYIHWHSKYRVMPYPNKATK